MSSPAPDPETPASDAAMPGPRHATASLTVTLAALAMIGPFSIDTVFPAFTRIGAEFGADATALQQLVSAYLAAFAVMSVFHGPLSDALGRKKVMIGGLAVYLVGVIGSLFAPSLGGLIVLRVLQGTSAGAATIVSRVVIRDLFEGAEAQRLMARVMMIFSLAPAIAPVIGGWLLLLGDWRWVFAGVGAYAILVLVLTCLLPETLPRERRTALRPGAIVGSLWHVGKSPALLRVAGATAFGFAGQFLFIASAPIIVTDLLGLGERGFWVLFAPLIIGMMAGAQTVGRLAEAMPRTRLITVGFASSIGAALVNLVLVSVAGAVGIQPTGGLHWGLLLQVAGPMLLAFTVSLIFAPIQLEIMDMFPSERGAAASLGTFFSLVLNAILAGAVAPLVTGSLVTLGTTALCFTLLGAAIWAWHLGSGRGRTERTAPASP